jgi:hypothetical protein
MTRLLKTRVCLALTVVLVPTIARANVGPKWWGDYVRETEGIREVAIVHEDLSLDLRPLANLEPAIIEATYFLQNSGAAKTLQLVFVVGNVSVDDFEVRLGDRLLESRRLREDENFDTWDLFPESWRPPKHGLGVDSRAGAIWLQRQCVTVEFVVELPSGASKLSACYHARACGVDEGHHPLATWQVPYVLAPAKSWGKFGDLDVTVQIPAGWKSASSLDLNRDGDVLRGTFTGVPADSFVVATRAPLPRGYERALWAETAEWILLLPGGLLACVLVGRYCGLLRARRAFVATKRGWTGTLINSAPFLVGVLWGAAVLIALLLTPRFMTASLAGQESPYFHERYMFLPCFVTSLVPGTVLIGAGVAFLTFEFTYRRRLAPK